jgi:hypothetical protein
LAFFGAAASKWGRWWPDLFGDPLLASAGIDRLAHRAEVLVITGASYRAQGRRRLEEEVLINEEDPEEDQTKQEE